MIGLLGLNHKSAPIEIRERFVFCEEDIKRFVPALKSEGFNGIIIISTCNRTEFYFDIDHTDITSYFNKLEHALFQSRKVDKTWLPIFTKNRKKMQPNIYSGYRRV